MCTRRTVATVTTDPSEIGLTSKGMHHTTHMKFTSSLSETSFTQVMAALCLKRLWA